MAQMGRSILVVDDEPAQRQLLTAVLEKDYQVMTAADGREARRALEQRRFDLIITDERMPAMSGIELIKWVREHEPATPVIMLTAYGSIQTAVEAMRLGAHDYLTKPLKSPEELRLVVSKAIGERVLLDQTLLHRAETEARFPKEIIAESERMKGALVLAARVAEQTTTVLLTGESGTGKEVVARFIHRHSPRAESAFVAINCAALTETLLESELFGHERGAVTGATQMKRGLFELAHGGTLFLDEIGEISFGLQAKLLRAIEERQFERVGGTRRISVDVRIIAATNKDLRQAIQQKGFREDLYYRLNVFPIHLPPLRERRDDVLPLAEHFIARISNRMDRQPKRLAEEVKHLLLSYDWPGNVRELQNAIERALIITPLDTIRLEDLPMHLSPVTESAPGPLKLADIERAAILERLSQNHSNRQTTADSLGISLRTLQYRLKEYGLVGKDEA